MLGFIFVSYGVRTMRRLIPQTHQPLKSAFGSRQALVRKTVPAVAAVQDCLVRTMCLEEGQGTEQSLNKAWSGYAVHS